MTAQTLTTELLAELEHTAATLARSVGDRILAMRAEGVNVAATKSSQVDVVTAADRTAEQLLTAGLATARPDDAVLGEEGASVQGTSGITWVLDPIDGTVNYLYGQPAFAVSVGAMIDDDGPLATADGRRAVAGAVYLPVLGELFSAYEGGGAKLNGATIHTSVETDLALTLLATGFGYTVERRTLQAEIARHMIPQTRDLRRLGSAATDLCMVASGRVDAYYEIGLNVWDYSAGVIIAREAGAVVLGQSAGELPGEKMMIVANPKLALKLQSALAAAYSAIGD